MFEQLNDGMSTFLDFSTVKALSFAHINYIKYMDNHTAIKELFFDLGTEDNCDCWNKIYQYMSSSNEPLIYKQYGYCVRIRDIEFITKTEINVGATLRINGAFSDEEYNKIKQSILDYHKN